MSERRRARDLSIFDIDNTARADIPPVRDLTVSAVSTRDVDEFSHRYHYTATGGNASWRWGLWHGMTLLGVVAYNLPTRNTCISVFGEQHHEHVWHMGRLVLAEHAPFNSESRLIGGSLRAIQREHPDVWAVLTFAAIDAGHIGWVYQATNALYTGLGGHAIYYEDARGHRRPTYDGWFISPTDARSRGWTVHEGQRKHRYVYMLGSRTQRRQRRALLQLPVLPYPKTLTTDDDVELEHDLSDTTESGLFDL